MVQNVVYIERGLNIETFCNSDIFLYPEVQIPVRQAAKGSVPTASAINPQDQRTIAMTIPFFATIALAMKDRRTGVYSWSAKVGLLLAILSLGLAASPIRDGLLRAKQTRNMAMHDVAAPLFDSVGHQRKCKAPQ